MKFTQASRAEKHPTRPDRRARSRAQHLERASRNAAGRQLATHRCRCNAIMICAGATRRRLPLPARDDRLAPASSAPPSPLADASAASAAAPCRRGQRPPARRARERNRDAPRREHVVWYRPAARASSRETKSCGAVSAGHARERSTRARRPPWRISSCVAVREMRAAGYAAAIAHAPPAP